MSENGLPLLLEGARPGFRKITLADPNYTQTRVQPPVKRSKPRNPIPFPAPAVASVINHLLRDAQKSAERKRSKGLDANQTWSQDLKNFSMCCRILRREVWKRKMERLVIRVDDEIAKVKEYIGPEGMGCIRTIELKPSLPKCKAATASTIPPSLDLKTCKKINAFLSTLSLETFIDNNIASLPSTKGGSIYNKSAKEVHIGLPCLSLQDMALTSAYPRCEHLVITEKEPHLFGDHFDLDSDIWEKTHPHRYLQKLMGGGPNPKIKELKINAVLPDELMEGEWAQNSGNMMFDLLCEMLPGLEKISLWFATPYTRDPPQACMVPHILNSCRRANLPLRELYMHSDGFSWIRLAEAQDNTTSDIEHLLATMLPGLHQLHLQELLPVHPFINNIMRDYFQSNARFVKFGFQHKDLIGQEVKVIRHYMAVRDYGGGTTRGHQPPTRKLKVFSDYDEEAFSILNKMVREASMQSSMSNLTGGPKPEFGDFGHGTYKENMAAAAAAAKASGSGKQKNGSDPVGHGSGGKGKGAEASLSSRFEELSDDGAGQENDPAHGQSGGSKRGGKHKGRRGRGRGRGKKA